MPRKRREKDKRGGRRRHGKEGHKGKEIRSGGSGGTQQRTRRRTRELTETARCTINERLTPCSNACVPFATNHWAEARQVGRVWLGPEWQCCAVQRRKLGKLDVGTEDTAYTQGMTGRISKRDKIRKRGKVRVGGEE